MDTVSSSADSFAKPAKQEVAPGSRSFSDFYRDEYGGVVRFAFVLSGDRWSAEDLAQDAFAATYRQWDRVGRYDNPEAFVRRAVANRSVSFFRRANVERRALARMDQRVQVEMPVLSAEAEEVWAAVRSLPRRQAQIVALVYLDGLSISEVAAVLGISPGTTKTHWRRARSRLARRLSVSEGQSDDA